MLSINFREIDSVIWKLDLVPETTIASEGEADRKNQTQI